MRKQNLKCQNFSPNYLLSAYYGKGRSPPLPTPYSTWIYHYYSLHSDNDHYILPCGQINYKVLQTCIFAYFTTQHNIFTQYLHILILLLFIDKTKQIRNSVAEYRTRNLQNIVLKIHLKNNVLQTLRPPDVTLRVVHQTPANTWQQ